MTNIQSMPAGVSSYLDSAEKMAQDIIRPKQRFVEGYTPYYRTPNIYYYDPIFPNYWGHNVHHYHHNAKNPSSDRESSNKSENAVLLGMALTAATGIMLYTVGSEYSKLSNVEEDFKKFERDRRLALIDLTQTGASLVKNYHFENITEIQRDILQTYKNDTITKLAIKGAVTSGCAMGAYVCAKAYFTNEFVTKASPVVGLISSLLIIGGGMSWMLKAGLDSTNQKVQRKAVHLFEAIQNFKSSPFTPGA